MFIDELIAQTEKIESAGKDLLQLAHKTEDYQTKLAIANSLQLLVAANNTLINHLKKELA